MDIRLTAAIITGKIIEFLIKLKGGGATAAPGLYALKIDPDLVKKLAKRIKHGSIVISGTNGKTTTSRLVSNILSANYKIIHNRQGSNLLRGIASTLISNSSLFGTTNADLAIWEVDEATLGKAVKNTSPQVITLLNLFRDQLDRYGEVDTVRTGWQKILPTLPKSASLILNADDPGISFLSRNFKGKVIYFGVNDQNLDLPRIENVADIKHCLNCGSTLNYSALLSAHMGHYTCPNCDFKRPNPTVSAVNLQFKPDFSTSARLTVNSEPLTVNYSLPGLYNVYNVLAASATSSSFATKTETIKKAIQKFPAAFGRFQKIKVNGKNVITFLIKNPAGANEVIRTLGIQSKFNLLVILNDKIADSRDVSWIWDTNWEILAPKIRSISVSGIRAWDMATRLKYAEIKLSKNNIYKDINYSIQKSLDKLSNNDTLIILPTYTALLKVQQSLAKLGGTKWHKD